MSTLDNSNNNNNNNNNNINNYNNNSEMFEEAQHPMPVKYL